MNKAYKGERIWYIKMRSQTASEHKILFEQLQKLLSNLYLKLDDRLDLQPQPVNQPLQHFASADGSITGSLRTFVGADVDWLVYSSINAPDRAFSTMRLTTWLTAQTQVPHLAFEFGLFSSQLFFYIDYIPRVDLWIDPEYVEQYYKPVEATYLKLRDNSNLTVFVSKGLYVRQIQSPIHLCFTCPATDDSFSLLQTVAHEMCDRWLSWVEQASSVPLERQATLAARDQRMRRITAECDPGNVIVAKSLGADLTNRIVRSLWDKTAI
jgi:hypothetical protein